MPPSLIFFCSSLDILQMDEKLLDKFSENLQRIFVGKRRKIRGLLASFTSLLMKLMKYS